ncbi:MAG: PQQ-dependent sugar dehydrogenase, partial [Myxococcota bacterium]|nr:PQQ-dependent sugar dehydrogenase [Myxococcota bacterium]
APDRPPSPGGVELTPVYEGVSFVYAVSLKQAPDDGSYWYVVEQTGRLLRFEATETVSTAQTVINLESEVTVYSEAGLLDLAFHPDFSSNGEIFLSYNTTVSGDLVSRVSRWTSTDGGATLDTDTEEVIFEVEQPYTNHNGGQIEFGHDGYLYFGLGDGGSAGDPLGSGQDTDTVLGAILRIDPDGGSPYAIPGDNPFADGSGAEEIYAWGLRNPWRFTIDPATGELWTGDVGQYDWEEVDLIELGGNYGWDIKEGTHCYSEDPCDYGWLVDPVVEYPNLDDASVIMGPVYRGDAMPALQGTPLFVDFYLGVIQGIVWDEVTGEAEITDLSSATGAYIPAFGQDVDGEAYVLNYYTGGILRLDPAEEEEESSFPEWLSGTGCMSAEDPSQPGSGLIPYDVNV